MADNEPAVATPNKKKKNPFPRKKKNDASKNNAPKNIEKYPAEPGTAKGGGYVNVNADTRATPRSNVPASERTANVFPPRQTVKRDEPRQPNVPKKRNINSPSAKKGNSPKVENNIPSKPSTAVGESSRKMEHPHDYRGHREDRNSHLMEMQRRQMEAERKWKWHDFFLSNPNDLVRLDRNKVIFLKAVEKNRPQAQFFCTICKYYCDNLPVVATHIRKTAHVRQLQDYNDEITIKEMPQMTKDQMWNLNEFLKKQVLVYSMDPINLETRRTIGVLVSELVSANLPGCSTRLFGSSIHGLGLKASDVNIDLQVPEGSLPPEMLKAVAALLKKSAHFVDVVENFHCEFPFISFKYQKSGENCSLSLNNERAVSLAVLLSKYTPLDPRLTQLASLFRLWGQLTETDKSQDGTWPGYAFYLLTIFYLQKCQDPVLPVLNDFLPNKGESEENNTAKVLSLDIGDIKQKWVTKNKQTLAQLWLGLLRFYAVEFNYTEYMVCIDSSALKPRNTRKLFIVDPFLPTRNVARSVSSNATFYYIMGCLMTTCRYFSMPQAKFGSLFRDIYVPSAKYHPELLAVMQTHHRINSHLIHLIMKLDTSFQLPRGDIQQRMSDVVRMMHNHDFKNIDNIPLTHIEQNCAPNRHLYGKMSVSPQDAQQLVSSFSAKFVEYSLSPHFFTGGEKVPQICGVCKQEGHLKDECPEEKLPILDPLPKRSEEDMMILDKLCVYIFDTWKQNEEDTRKRERICEELQEFIEDELPTARLELFGSTKNGFGLKRSDIDICLSFEDNKTGEGLDTRGFIEILYRMLKSFKALQDLLPIATAKVPIVKFTHRATKLDGDISLYNVLALENSKLLYTYAKIDERARILGYMIKRFSKVCHIGDASKGSLSSYAYTLLVIFFLQRCDPPVLPVLQELTENGEPPPKHIVEGCNAYFFSDLSKLDTVWKGRNKNQKSVGELWLDLLIFYTETFDMLNNVICIRCSRAVSKFEKLWISKGIAIEDPFDLSHNLGSALTRKMSLYIIKALRKGRNHFGRPVKIPLRDVKDIEAYFMNMKELTDGEPPNDRGCRVCKSIGHKERECPEKKKKKGKKGIRNTKKTQNEKPSKKELISEDEDGDPELSDSDNGSSDQEDHRSLREAPKKFVDPAPPNQNRGNDGNNVGLSKSSKPFPLNKKERPNVGFKKTVPTSSVGQDPNCAPGSPSSPFPAYSKTPVSVSRNPNSNSNLPPMRLNISASPINKTDVGLVPQNQNSASNPALIPTIIFSNSKLTSDPVPKHVPNPPVTPIRYPFPPGQETSRPPPGFIPISPNPQQYPSVSFPLDQNSPSPKGPWIIDNFTRLPYVPMIPVTPAGVTPGSPIGMRFNNGQVLGMLGPTEQLIWGQSPSPGPAQPPPFTTQRPPSHTLGCEAALANMKINTDVPTGTQNNLSHKDSNVGTSQNKADTPFTLPNAPILNNMT